MSPSLFLTSFALTLALASLAGARRSPIPAAPIWVAVLVVVLAVAGLLGPEPLRWAAVGLALTGLFLPALVLARIRQLAGRGRYGEAARLLRRLLRVRRSPVLDGWAQVWEATEALVNGDTVPAEALVDRWRDDPDAHIHREWLIGILWRWSEAASAQTPDLRTRAACELGDVESAIHLCAQRMARRSSPFGLARHRLDWLPAVAFSGRVAATEVTARLLRLSAPSPRSGGPRRCPLPAARRMHWPPSRTCADVPT